MTTARYSHPSNVQIYVMSPTQTQFGVDTENLRLRRLGATGNVCLLSVVALNFFRCLAATPASFINVAALCLPQSNPMAFSSWDILRLPYVAFVS